MANELKLREEGQPVRSRYGNTRLGETLYLLDVAKWELAEARAEVARLRKRVEELEGREVSNA